MQKNPVVIVVALLLLAGAGWFVMTRLGETPESPPGGTASAPYGEPSPPAVPEPAPSPKKSPSSIPIMHHLVTIKTNLGSITFETYDADAPNTVSNFLALANKGFYNGTIFHRVIPGFMIQGGDPTGTGTGGPGYKFADELDPSTASFKQGYVKGVVAMANAGKNTNGSQFFIMQADYPLGHDYTIFGKVVSGQDVVDKIATAPTLGDENRPVNPVAMQSVTVEEAK